MSAREHCDNGLAPVIMGAVLTVWLTGLPAAGKSTIAGLVTAELRSLGQRVVVLDGDVVRQSLSSDLGFGEDDRKANARRVAHVADLLSRSEVFAVVALVSPYRASREEARSLMGARFVEVYVNASLDACVARDPKGLYSSALRGEKALMTGVSDPYEPPEQPELVLDTEHERPEESAARLIALIRDRARI